MLILDNICKDYGKDELLVRALKDVSLTFERNEFVSVLGPSGCGKTTLLNIVGGLDKFTSGDLIINGKSTKEYKNIDWDTYRNHNIGFVFQTYNLISHQNILDNVELTQILTGLNKEQRREKAKEALIRVGLEKHLKKRPAQLSSGQAQRAAIARAIVNNPDIILADEPTGALDNETSVQIMELLKEVAADKLIIMVTHNPELAYRYSTRIIRISDGCVISDEKNVPEGASEREAYGENTFFDTEEAGGSEMLDADAGSAAKEKTRATDAAETGNKKLKKPSMSFPSTFKLSCNNLLQKRGRTLLTTVAGSIAIICIALILALNSGFSNYILKFEKKSLAEYPITIENSNSFLTDMMEELAAGKRPDLSTLDIDTVIGLIKEENALREAYPDMPEVYIDAIMESMLRNIEKMARKPDISPFMQYVTDNFDFSLAAVKYDYNLALNVYRKSESGYDRLNPFGYRALSIASMVAGGTSQEMIDTLMSTTSKMAIWDMMIDDRDTLDTQYDLLAGSWPDYTTEKGMRDIVLVVDEYNQISDYLMFALGYTEISDLIAAVLLGQTPKTTYKFKEFIGHKFYMILDSDYYQPDAASGLYKDMSGKTSEMNGIVEAKGVELNISGIVRIKEGVGKGCIDGIIGYTQALAEYVINTTNASDVVAAQTAQYAAYLEATQKAAGLQAQLASGEKVMADLTPAELFILSEAAKAVIKNVSTGESMSAADYSIFISKLGVRDLVSPEAIYFYPNSIEAKSEVIKFIETFNAKMTAALENGEVDGDYTVKYTDELSDIIASLKSMVNIITYILVGVTCIAVIVSLFMISIIMYISVQDRTKEIGILRSIGARQFDIMWIFNMETLLLGLVSSILGIAVSFILTAPLNAIFKSLLGTTGIIQPLWWHSFVLIGGSVVLTVISGLIPAIKAARKNPVTALKTE